VLSVLQRQSFERDGELVRDPCSVIWTNIGRESLERSLCHRESQTDNDDFRYAVALAGDIAVVGAGRVDVYDLDRADIDGYEDFSGSYCLGAGRIFGERTLNKT
jgi:hypothetical protein